MQTLKTFSIVGLVLYPILLIFAVLMQPIINIIWVIFFLYAISHAAFGCIQGIENKKKLLKISSIFCWVILFILLLLSFFTMHGITGDLRNDLQIQSILAGSIISSTPFAIVLSAITLILSSRELKKMET